MSHGDDDNTRQRRDSDTYNTQAAGHYGYEDTRHREGGTGKYDTDPVGSSGTYGVDILGSATPDRTGLRDADPSTDNKNAPVRVEDAYMGYAGAGSDDELRAGRDRQSAYGQGQGHGQGDALSGGAGDQSYDQADEYSVGSARPSEYARSQYGSGNDADGYDEDSRPDRTGDAVYRSASQRQASYDSREGEDSYASEQQSAPHETSAAFSGRDDDASGSTDAYRSAGSSDASDGGDNRLGNLLEKAAEYMGKRG